MKTKALILGVASMLMLAVATPSFAQDANKDKKDKKVTIVGEGKCAKCAMKESDKCQNVIEGETKSGKKRTYYLVQNDVSKEFHENICKGPKKVKATGTVKKNGDKLEMTADKIEVVKE